jgi:heme oxygenase
MHKSTDAHHHKVYISATTRQKYESKKALKKKITNYPHNNWKNNV